jgi:hypothetical protein
MPRPRVDASLYRTVGPGTTVVFLGHGPPRLILRRTSLEPLPTGTTSLACPITITVPFICRTPYVPPQTNYHRCEFILLRGPTK